MLSAALLFVLIFDIRAYCTNIVSVDGGIGDSHLNLIQTRSSIVVSPAGTRPHIVFVLADDLGWNGIGYNNGEITTPALDQLARDGVELTSYYASPECAPSRFSFLTGRLAWKSEANLAGNFYPGTPVGTSLDYTMLPLALKAVGYKTHMIGKWHQGYHRTSYYPQHRGFDTFFGNVGGCTFHFTQAPCRVSKSQTNLIDLMDSDHTIVFGDSNRTETGDDRYRKRAVQLIEDHDSAKPFFLYLSLQNPHDPNEVSSEYSSAFKFYEEKNVLFGMIAHIDNTVNEVCKALRRNRMWEDTVFVFSSDNGASTFYTESLTQEVNYPLRGGKHSVWQGGIRVPAFVSGGFIPSSARGSKRHGQMNAADWYATFANLAGAQMDTSGPFASDSKDNWMYIIGTSNTSSRNGALFWTGKTDDGRAFIESNRWKLVSSKGDCAEHPCLFDLQNDEAEQHDLSAKEVDVVSRLHPFLEHDGLKKRLNKIHTLKRCEDIGFTRDSFMQKFYSVDGPSFLGAFQKDVADAFDGCVDDHATMIPTD